MNLSSKLVRSWNEYWFGKAPAFDLAVLRILFFGMLTWRYIGRTELNWHMMQHGGVWHPQTFFKLGMPVLEEGPMFWVYQARLLSYLLCTLGLFTRTSASLALLSSLYISGLAQNFGKYTGGGIDVVLFVMGTFALSRPGDYLSLDRLIAVWRKRKNNQDSLWRAWLKAPDPSGQYRWPIRFGWMMLFTLYFTAGVSKLMKTGFDWALTDNLSNLLIRHHYSHKPPTEIGLWAASHPFAYKTIGLGSLMTELLCPLGMLWRWPRYFFATALLSMQFGIYLTLGVAFHPVKLLALPFIPYLAALSGLKRSLGRPGATQRKQPKPAP